VKLAPLGAVLLATYLVRAAASLQAAAYVGAGACAECHQQEYRKQTASHHAHALQPIEGSLLGSVLLRESRSPDGRLVYEQAGRNIVVREENASEVLTLEWAFGAGAQGSTAVGRLDHQYIEHRFSYYSRIQGLAPTFGHAEHVSTPIAELGVFQDSRTIFRCFHCHGTGVRPGPQGPDLTHFLPGVQCERCHGPGSSHIQAARARESVVLIQQQIVNPGRFPAKAVIEICGQCHRLPEPDMGDEPELENPVTVRFAPIGLLASRCFRSSRTLSCLTCHDPHADVRPASDLFYTERCLDCHAGDTRPVKYCRRLQRANCLPCHMKKANLSRYLQFTDHRIRVYGGGIP
jgi:hypothetical protein